MLVVTRAVWFVPLIACANVANLVLLSLLTGLLFGIVPAWQVSRQGVGGALKESTRTSGDVRRQRTRSGLMVAEIALSLVLLIGAGLMMKSFFRLSQTTPGFNPTGVVTMEIGLPTSKYKNPQQWSAFFSGALDKVRALPGVRSAGTVLPLPLGGGGWQTGFTFEGRQMQTNTDLLLTDISPDRLHFAEKVTV